VEKVSEYLDIVSPPLTKQLGVARRI